MTTILLVIHLMLAIALVSVVLLQRSEGGALGIGGGMGGLMSGRGAGNLLTRSTAVLAGCFMATSLLLAILAGGREQPRSIIEDLAVPPQEAPAAPAEPSVPLRQ
jgi:preprotein translocase subunit SecG